MKKILSVFLTFILLAAFCGVALAEEKMVQLNIASCSAWGSKARISSILKKIDGVKNQGNMEQDLLIITFDDKKTTPKIIINELKKKGFIAKDQPIYWKKVKKP